MLTDAIGKPQLGGGRGSKLLEVDAVSDGDTAKAAVPAKTVQAPQNTVVFEQVADNLGAATQYGALVVCTNAAGTGFNSTTSKSAITPMPAPLDARITPQAGSVAVSFVLSAFYTGLSDWRKQYTYCNVTLSSGGGGKTAFALTPALNATALPGINVTFKSDSATAVPPTTTYEASIYCNDTGSGAPSLIASAALKPAPLPAPAPAPAPKRSHVPKPAPAPGAAPSPGDYEDYATAPAAQPSEADDYEYDYFVSNHPPADDGGGGDAGGGGGGDGSGDDADPEER
jgi:hypothetical protein